MQNVEKISIALPPEMTALMRQAVKAGEYASTSEVIRDALREWTYRHELRQRGLDELRALWDEAINLKTAVRTPRFPPLSGLPQPSRDGCASFQLGAPPGVAPPKMHHLGRHPFE